MATFIVGRSKEKECQSWWEGVYKNIKVGVGDRDRTGGQRTGQDIFLVTELTRRVFHAFKSTCFPGGKDLNAGR